MSAVKGTRGHNSLDRGKREGHDGRDERSPSHLPAGLRAFTAAAIMGVALALATWLGGLTGASASPDQPFVSRITVAGTVCVAVVGVILLLRLRIDRAPLAEMGLTGLRSDARGFLLGAAAVLACGAVVIGPITLFGWARWTDLDAVALIGFIASNSIIALLLEAIPEEIAIRGYALSSLRQGFTTRIAGTLGIVTFLLVPPIALGTGWVLEQSNGGGIFALSPGGQDGLTYYAMLAAFGLLLTYARDSTEASTVWTCIGAHLAWLTVNRIVLGGANGIRVELAPGAEVAFFAIYTVVAVTAFSLLSERVRESHLARTR